MNILSLNQRGPYKTLLILRSPEFSEDGLKPVEVRLVEYLLQNNIGVSHVVSFDTACCSHIVEVHGTRTELQLLVKGATGVSQVSRAFSWPTDNCPTIEEVTKEDCYDCSEEYELDWQQQLPIKCEPPESKEQFLQMYEAQGVQFVDHLIDVFRKNLKEVDFGMYTVQESSLIAAVDIDSETLFEALSENDSENISEILKDSIPAELAYKIYCGEVFEISGPMSVDGEDKAIYLDADPTEARFEIAVGYEQGAVQEESCEKFDNYRKLGGSFILRNKATGELVIGNLDT